MSDNGTDMGTNGSERGVRVLVVESDASTAWMLIQRLSEVWPFEGRMLPDYASTSRRAMACVLALRYDLIFLDWELPDLGAGEGLLRAFRRDGIIAPVIVVSENPIKELPVGLDVMGLGFLCKRDLNLHAMRRAIALATGKLVLRWFPMQQSGATPLQA